MQDVHGPTHYSFYLKVFESLNEKIYKIIDLKGLKLVM